MDLPPGEAHVWCADLDAAGWPGADRLPAPERARASSRLGAEARRRWVASRWALRQLLGRYLGLDPAAVDLAVDEGGKPRVRQAAGGLEFNLSHSGPLALVALCRRRAVGVDVEKIEPGRDFVKLADRALPAEDAAAVRAAGGAARSNAFYDRWARHEAVVKCLGGGLGSPLGASPVAVRSLTVASGYAAAVAVAGDELPRLSCRKLRPSPSSPD